MNKKELKKEIEYLKEYYFSNSKLKEIKCMLLHDSKYNIYKYILYLRKEEYYFGRNNVLSHFYQSKKNKLSNITGFEIPRFTCGLGLKIAHYGHLIINGYSKIGKNALFFGGACIGWNGTDKGVENDLEYQKIGDNVVFGINCSIFGKLTLGNNIIIGSGAIVLNNFCEDNITLVGVPARKVKK